MKILTDIYNELYDDGVFLFSGSYDLPQDCDAATVKYSDAVGIFLDVDKIKTLAQEKEAVSHEWAHVKTDATYHMDAPADVIRRAEVRAVRAQIKKSPPVGGLVRSSA